MGFSVPSCPLALVEAIGVVQVVACLAGALVIAFFGEAEDGGGERLAEVSGEAEEESIDGVAALTTGLKLTQGRNIQAFYKTKIRHTLL